MSKLSQSIQEIFPKIIDKLIETGSLMETIEYFPFGYSGVYNAIKKSQYSYLLTRGNNGKSKKAKMEQVSRLKIKKKEIDNIIELYYKELKDLYEIASIYKTTPATVLYFFRRHGIKTRSKSEANKLRFEKNPELREHQRQLVFSGKIGYPKNSKRRSWIELACEEWLHENKIGYVKEFRINGFGHSYDFKVADTLIEMDGCYWHENQKQHEKDIQFECIAKENGYNVIRITDRELYNFGKSIFCEKLGYLKK